MANLPLPVRAEPLPSLPSAEMDELLRQLELYSRRFRGPLRVDPAFDIADLVQMAAVRVLRWVRNHQPQSTRDIPFRLILKRVFLSVRSRRRCSVMRDGVEESVLDGIDRRQPQPWEPVVMGELADLCRARLERVPAVARILELRLEHDLTYAEIATLQHANAATLGVKVYRFKQELRHLLA